MRLACMSLDVDLRLWRAFCVFEEDMADAASKTETIREDTLTEPLKNKSWLLYAPLSQIRSMQALNIVRLCQNAFTAWHRALNIVQGKRSQFGRFWSLSMSLD